MIKKIFVFYVILLMLMLSQFAFAGGVTIITHGYGNGMSWVHDAGDKLILRNGGNATVAEYLITLNETDISLICQNGVKFGSAANTSGHAVVKLNWTKFSGESCYRFY